MYCRNHPWNNPHPYTPCPGLSTQFPPIVDGCKYLFCNHWSKKFSQTYYNVGYMLLVL